jgi:hypothetical protein
MNLKDYMISMMSRYQIAKVLSSPWSVFLAHLPMVAALPVLEAAGMIGTPRISPGHKLVSCMVDPHVNPCLLPTCLQGFA